MAGEMLEKLKATPHLRKDKAMFLEAMREATETIIAGKDKRFKREGGRDPPPLRELSNMEGLLSKSKRGNAQLKAFK